MKPEELLQDAGPLREHLEAALNTLNGLHNRLQQLEQRQAKTEEVIQQIVEFIQKSAGNGGVGGIAQALALLRELQGPPPQQQQPPDPLTGLRGMLQLVRELNELQSQTALRTIDGMLKLATGTRKLRRVLGEMAEEAEREEEP